MRRLYDGGATLAEVGQAFGVSKQRVHSLFRKHGIPRRLVPYKRPSPCTPELVAAMRESYDAGANLRTVARQFGFAENTVRRAFEHHGIPRRACANPLSEERVLAMREYYEDYHSLDETAARFGVSRMAVHEVFVRRGIPRRKQGVRLRRG